MLMGVVEGGTGKMAMLEDYTAGGKTSTAQKANPRGGYFNEKVVVSFIGMIPAMNPRIVLLVAVNEPKGDERTLFGGKVTAPAFARIADRVLKHLKVPPDRSLTLEEREEQLLKNNKITVKQEIIKLPNLISQMQVSVASSSILASDTCELVPDLRGQSLKAAIQTINRRELKAIFEGNGVVIAQQPPPGRPLPNSRILRVKLSPDFIE